MTTDPAFIVEPIVIGSSIAVALLLLLGLRRTHPGEPAARERHKRVWAAIAVTLAVWFVLDYGLAQSGVF